MTHGAAHAADLMIVGGGIHGCSAAMFAARRGLDVIVIEKDTVARHASGSNAGGVRRLGRHLAEVPISQHSMQIWYGLPDLVADDCGFQVAPQIKVAETEAELDGLRKRAATLRGMGFAHEVVLERDALRAHLPAVADHVTGGLACLEDGFAQPYQTTFAIARKAKAEGARIFEGTAVAHAGGGLHSGAMALRRSGHGGQASGTLRRELLPGSGFRAQAEGGRLCAAPSPKKPDSQAEDQGSG
ncbi:NAD(P)/FAD-dependent oxidoreductase [Mangrovicoccus ximenensis]|uniref:NAD(P)/FAD-dependent oxidoreductase n=1 Tax=Mangrovicoccus ximenensis TaxID=1911570 RepID=UPI000D3599BF|nr:FAD-dependent oxidoreductase [Mangrovicoccus ximenensis]